MLLRWVLLSAAVFISAYIIPGVVVTSVVAVIVTALVLGLLNAILKPIVILLTLPINILTLGLFTFVINALFIMLVGKVVPGFEVESFLWALLFSVILSIISYALGHMVHEIGKSTN